MTGPVEHIARLRAQHAAGMLAPGDYEDRLAQIEAAWPGAAWLARKADREALRRLSAGLAVTLTDMTGIVKGSRL